MALGFDLSPQVMHKFWIMLSVYHGQIFNASELSTALMGSSTTVVCYLQILQGTFMIGVLQPWFENMKKRQIKTPKLYFKDIGIFNYLALISVLSDLTHNPKIGAIWEGFAIEQIITCLQISEEDCYFGQHKIMQKLIC